MNGGCRGRIEQGLPGMCCSEGLLVSATLYRVFLMISMWTSSKSCSEMHFSKYGAAPKGNGILSNDNTHSHAQQYRAP